MSSKSPRHLRVFLSSPGDVKCERDRARAILKELERAPAWKGKFSFDPLSWDDPDAPAPMDAGLTPQQAVDRGLAAPSECDVVVVIFWHRMGTPLSAPRKPDGSAYLSGTEYEFEDALNAHRRPRILLYRRTDPPPLSPASEAPEDERQQRDRVEAFFDRFRARDGTLSGGYSAYEALEGFERRFRQDVEMTLRELEGSGPAAGPPLELRTHALDRWTRLNFRARGVPVVGRTQETERLDAFLSADRAFCWWIVTGPAGSGKSRLALELALSQRPAWETGFLPVNHGFTQWYEWQPVRPTLVIVDYVHQREEDVRSIIVALGTRATATRSPVRMLLLEREATDSNPWWLRFLGSGSAAHAMRTSRFDEPLHLRPLSDEDLWSIIAARFEALGAPSLPDRNEIVAELVNIDVERRPLFAALAADALAEGRSIRSWDRERLLEDFLMREDERSWRPAGVTDRDKHLLALATMIGGVDVTILADTPVSDLLPGARPGPDRFHAVRYQALSGTRAERRADSLKPDIVGEFFALELLRPTDALDDRAHRIWKEACRLDVVMAFTFLERSEEDFPDHATLPFLGEIATETPLARMVSVLDLLFRQGNLAEAGRLDDVVTRFRELCGMVRAHPEPGLISSLGLVAGDYVKLMVKNQRVDEARRAHLELLALEGELPAQDRELAWDGAAERSYDIVTTHCLSGDGAAAREALGDTRSLMACVPDRSDVRRHFSGAAYNVVTRLAEQAEFDLAFDVCRELLAATVGHAADDTVRDRFMQAANNLFVYSGRSGDLAFSERVLRELVLPAQACRADVELTRLASRHSFLLANSYASHSVPAAAAMAQLWIRLQTEAGVTPESLDELAGIADLARAFAERSDIEGAESVLGPLLALLPRFVEGDGKDRPPEMGEAPLRDAGAALEVLVDALCGAGQASRALTLIKPAFRLLEMLNPGHAALADALAGSLGNLAFQIGSALLDANADAGEVFELLSQAISACGPRRDENLPIGLPLLAQNILITALNQEDGELAKRTVRLALGAWRGDRFRNAVRDVNGPEAPAQLDALVEQVLEGTAHPDEKSTPTS